MEILQRRPFATNRFAAWCGEQGRVYPAVMKKQDQIRAADGGPRVIASSITASKASNSIYVHFTHARRNQLPNPLDLLGKPTTNKKKEEART